MCRYKDPDAGFEVAHPYYEWCKAWAHDGRVKRGLPIPYNWDEFFDDQLCKAVPQACYEIPDVKETTPSFMQMALGFTKSMVTWIKQGFPIVDYETYKARYVTCAGDENTPRCPRFTTFAGTGVVRCGACGCSSLKLFLGGNNKCPIGKWGPTP